MLSHPRMMDTKADMRLADRLMGMMSAYVSSIDSNTLMAALPENQSEMYSYKLNKCTKFNYVHYT